MHRSVFAVLLAAGALLGTPAGAAPDPAAKCEADKNVAAGTYAACRHAAFAKAVKKDPANPLPDFSKCDAKVLAKWAKIETKGGAACPTTGDDTAIQALVASHVAAVSDAVGGGGVGCGNDVLDVLGELCDGADLGGATCSDLGYFGGSLACTATCGFDTSACTQPPCDALLGGACWFFGAPGASCDATCAALGLVYDDTTAEYAGTGAAATFGRCDAVLEALNAPTDDFGDFACSDGVAAATSPEPGACAASRRRRRARPSIAST